MYALTNGERDPMWICWTCSNIFYQRLQELNITEPPNKKLRINEAKRIATAIKEAKAVGERFIITHKKTA